MKINKEKAQNLINSIIGLPVSAAKQGNGSYITIDLGEEIEYSININKEKRIIRRNEWRLWLYMCSWRFDKNDIPFAGCEDSRKKISNAIALINGRRIISCQIISNAFDMILCFDNHISLNLFSFYTTKNEQWFLFTPDRKVITAGPGKNITYMSSNE